MRSFDSAMSSRRSRSTVPCTSTGCSFAHPARTSSVDSVSGANLVISRLRARRDAVAEQLRRVADETVEFVTFGTESEHRTRDRQRYEWEDAEAQQRDRGKQWIEVHPQFPLFARTPQHRDQRG